MTQPTFAELLAQVTWNEIQHTRYRIKQDSELSAQEQSLKLNRSKMSAMLREKGFPTVDVGFASLLVWYERWESWIYFSPSNMTEPSYELFRKGLRKTL